MRHSILPLSFLVATTIGILACSQDSPLQESPHPTMSALPDGHLLSQGYQQFLVRDSNGALIKTIHTSPDLLQVSAMLPDGTYALIADDRRNLSLWNSQGEDAPRHIDSSSKPTLAAALSLDRETLITLGPDYILRFFGTEDGHLASWISLDTAPLDFYRPFFAFDFPRPLLRATFSAHGRYVVTFTKKDPVAYVWDTQTGKLLMSLDGHGTSVSGVVFSANEDLAVSYSNAQTFLWTFNPRSHEPGTRIYLHPSPALVTSAAFASDGTKLILALQNQKRFLIQVWDVSTRTLLLTVPLPDIVPVAVAIQNDHAKAFVLSKDGVIYPFDLSPLVEQIPVQNSSVPILSATFSSDESQILTVDASHMARIYHQSSKSPSSWILDDQDQFSDLLNDSMTSAIFSPSDPNTILTVSKAPKLWHFDGHSWALSSTFNIPETDVNSANFSADGQNILITRSSSLFDIVTWNPGTAKWELSSTMPTGSRAGYCAEFSKEGTSLFTETEGRAIQIWQKSGLNWISNSNQVISMPANFYCNTVKFGQNDLKLIAAHADGMIRIWQKFEDSSGTQTNWVNQDKPFDTLNFLNLVPSFLSTMPIRQISTGAKDSNILAHDGNTFILWNFSDLTWTHTASFHSSSDPIYSATLTQDGSKALVAVGHTVKLWNVTPPKILIPFPLDPPS